MPFEYGDVVSRNSEQTTWRNREVLVVLAAQRELLGIHLHWQAQPHKVASSNTVVWLRNVEA